MGAFLLIAFSLETDSDATNLNAEYPFLSIHSCVDLIISQADPYLCTGLVDYPALIASRTLSSSLHRKKKCLLFAEAPSEVVMRASINPEVIFAHLCIMYTYNY